MEGRTHSDIKGRCRCCGGCISDRAGDGKSRRGGYDGRTQAASLVGSRMATLVGDIMVVQRRTSAGQHHRLRCVRQGHGLNHICVADWVQSGPWDGLDRAAG